MTGSKYPKNRDTGGVRPMLIFDGDCSFCTSAVQWLQPRLPDDVEVVPRQFVDLDALGLTEHDVTTAAYWVDAWGHPHRGHRAAAKALLAAGGGWAVLGVLGLFPPTSWVAAGLYRLIADNRHRLPGGTPACKIDAH
jgi:predicted DCC family thiol-disulfide oxidoreductase YuxK